jgi:hypothetical protein
VRRITGYNWCMLRPALALLTIFNCIAFARSAGATPPAGPGAASTSAAPCGDPTCGAPSLTTTPAYSAHIARDGRFSAEVSIDQPCGCTRTLTLLLAFTPPATTATRELSVKLKVAPGVTTRSLALTSAELAAAKIVPGRYAITFALYDERDVPAGKTLSGNPFSYGTSKSTLRKRPLLPTTIAREAPLEVPFEFDNAGDTGAPATALLVFTRPGGTRGIEYYVRDLLVPPGGAKHVVSLSAESRRELGIGHGAWLVTASAFDGAGERMGSYAGNILTIGTVLLSLPKAPRMGAVIEAKENFRVDFTVDNRGDAEDELTAVVIFRRVDSSKPIEFQLDGIRAAPGPTGHMLVLTPQERASLGIGTGVWKLAFTALDRTGKRLETHRGHDLVIR